jgi:hypothetical protein
MANNSYITTAQAKLALDIITGVAGGAGAGFNLGTLEIYDGTQPANADDAITTQNLLGTYTFAATGFGAAAGTAGNPAVATAGTITGGNAVYTASATWARAKKSGGTVIQDFSVATASADINLSSVVFTSGVAMPTITAMTLTLPLKNGL